MFNKRTSANFEKPKCLFESIAFIFERWLKEELWKWGFHFDMKEISETVTNAQTGQTKQTARNGKHLALISDQTEANKDQRRRKNNSQETQRKINH